MRKPVVLRVALVSMICVLAASAAHAAGPAGAEQPPIGFDALLGFDRLPLLVDWPAYQDSSYARKRGTGDAGNFLTSSPTATR